VSDVTHYTPANPGSAEYLTTDEQKSLHLDEPDAYMLKIYFLAGCSASRQVQRNLERGQSRPVTPAAPPIAATLAPGATVLEVRAVSNASARARS